MPREPETTQAGKRVEGRPIACVTWWYDACQDQHFEAAPEYAPVLKTDLQRLLTVALEHPKTSAEVVAGCRFEKCRAAGHCQTMPCKHRMLLREELEACTNG